MSITIGKQAWAMISYLKRHGSLSVELPVAPQNEWFTIDTYSIFLETIHYCLVQTPYSLRLTANGLVWPYGLEKIGLDKCPDSFKPLFNRSIKECSEYKFPMLTIKDTGIEP